MQHEIVADTKALCRVCMASDVEHPADLYDVSPSGLLPTLHEMLKAVCAPVFEKPEAEVLMPEMPTKVCQVCQNAIVAAYKLHQQCIETDRRLGEFVALMWELQGGDELVEDGGDPGTSSSQEVTFSMRVEKEDEISKQTCIPSKSKVDKICLDCGKTFSNRSSLVRHIRDSFCDMTNDPKKRTCEICNKVLKTVQLLKRHREMHVADVAKQAESDEPSPAAELPASTQEPILEGDRPVEELNDGGVDVIKVEALDIIDENEDSLLESILNEHAECNNCGISFSSIRAHRDHVQAGNCQRTITYPCKICGKVFDKQTRLQYHLYTHKERVACLGCDDTFRNRAGLLVHIRRKRCSGEKLRKPQNVSQRELEPKVGSASSTKKQQHPEEYGQNKEEEVYTEEENNESLVVEMPAPQRDTSTDVTKAIDIQCTKCGVTFTSSRAHKMHTQEENCQLKRTYPCKICGKIFDKHSRRTYHYYTHRERYPCSICNENFRSQASLMRHRCSAKGSSQTPQEDGINEPLIEQALVPASTSSKALGDPLLNSEALQVVKVEEPDIEDVEMTLESEIFVEPIDVAEAKKTCKICSETFERMATLRWHTQRNHQLYICGKCCETFKTEQMLEDHKKVSHVVVAVNCAKCDQSFESQTALRMHKRYGSCLQEPEQTPKTFPCDLCEKTFESAVKLGYHRSNHNSRVYCDQCGYRWGSKSELQAHIAKGKCLGDKARTCYVCKKVFETVAEYKKHRLEAHPGPVDCPDCGRTQANLHTFRMHQKEGRCESIRNRTAPGIIPRTCKICGEIQLSVSQLRSHMKTNHLDQIHYCTSCLRQFPTQEKFDAHMEKHEKNMVNICQTCNTSFPTMAALKRHKFTHIGPVKCKICERSFVRNFDLKAHMTIHTGEKPYACHCRMRFRTALGMRQHMRTHSNQRPITECVCDQCGSKFTSTQTLKLHVMTAHEGLRPFPCTLCELKFSRPQHLKRHMLTHTKEKPYKCAICPQAYAQSSELVRHVAREHGDGKPYACDRCDESFRVIAELRKHYAEHIQEGDDSTTGGEGLRFTSVALLNMRFAKEKQQQRDGEGGDSQ